MNYQNYFPASYQPMYSPQPIQQPQMVQQAPQMTQVQQPQQTQIPNNPIIWCQGESGAKSYMVAPSQSVMLMDSESNTFFIKSADASGMPLPLRIFDYKERTQQPHTEPQIQQQVEQNNYITREEFEQRIAEIVGDKKQSVPTQRKEKQA